MEKSEALRLYDPATQVNPRGNGARFFLGSDNLAKWMMHNG